MRRSNSRGAKLRSPHLLGQVHSDLEAPAIDPTNTSLGFSISGRQFGHLRRRVFASLAAGAAAFAHVARRIVGRQLRWPSRARLSLARIPYRDNSGNARCWRGSPLARKRNVNFNGSWRLAPTNVSFRLDGRFSSQPRCPSGAQAGCFGRQYGLGSFLRACVCGHSRMSRRSRAFLVAVIRPI